MKKVGRPAVSEKRKTRSFKATDTEWQAIQRMAAERGLSASEYLRNVTLRKEENYMKKKMDWNETFDLNENGDFFATEVEFEEGSQYVYFHGTYRNIEGQEFAGAILEVFLSDPVHLDADGNIVIPATWENFWVLGHEMEYDCCEFDIGVAFGSSYVYVSPEWEKFLSSFTDGYKEYPPRIAPNRSLQRLGLYYFEKDIAVLVTPAGIYSHGAASLTLRGPAYRPLSKFFEIWGE